MYGQNIITITPVANGFIVSVPAQHQPEGADFLNLLPKMVRNLNKDEIIQKSEEALKEAEKEFNERNIDTYRTPTVFTFATFREVLFFLAERFDVSLAKQ